MRLHTRHAALHFVGAAATAVVALTESSPTRAQVAVDLEVVFAIDNSRSNVEEELAVQRDGIVAAFRDPEVIRLIQAGALGRIAVLYLAYASIPYGYAGIVHDWTVISDSRSAISFADKVAAASIPFGAGTALAEGLVRAAQLMTINEIEGTRRSILVSGDGPNNATRFIEQARDEVAAGGIRIDGLPLMTGDGLIADPNIKPSDMHNYYAMCVAAGDGSFVMPIRRVSDYVIAVRKELGAPIVAPDVPPPSINPLQCDGPGIRLRTR